MATKYHQISLNDIFSDYRILSPPSPSFSFRHPPCPMDLCTENRRDFPVSRDSPCVRTKARDYSRYRYRSLRYAPAGRLPLKARFHLPATDQADICLFQRAIVQESPPPFREMHPQTHPLHPGSPHSNPDRSRDRLRR